MAIKYPALSPLSQRELWTDFITNHSQRPTTYWLSATLLDNLAGIALNGRQIKNVVCTATALAVAAERELDLQDIHTSLKSIEGFERDFVEAIESNYDPDGDLDAPDYERHLAPRNELKRRRLAKAP